MLSVGGNITAAVQIKTVEKNEIGEGVETWSDSAVLTGWLDLNYCYTPFAEMASNVTGTTSTTATATKTVAEIADEVVAGNWGNGDERKTALEAAGYDYSEVQAAVNALMSGTTNTKSVAEIAREVIAGKWGNGDERKTALEAAGYDYAAVQAAVNKLMS